MGRSAVALIPRSSFLRPPDAASFALLSNSPLKFYQAGADIIPGAEWLYPGHSDLRSWLRRCCGRVVDRAAAFWYHNLKRFDGIFPRADRPRPRFRRPV